MPTIKAPDTFRVYRKSAQLNSYHTDYNLPNGTRISCPFYIDVSTSDRKELLNAIRTVCAQVTENAVQPDSLSGIQTVSYSTLQPDVEAYIGMSVDNLRNVLFQRGGLAPDLLFKLQEVAGMEFVSHADIKKAMTEKLKVLKTWLDENQFLQEAGD